jgi:predicted permease
VNLVSQRFAAEQAAALGSLHPQVVRAQKQTVTLVSAATGYAPERRRYGVPLRILTAVTALLLLVACANFTNLVLARARAHRRELAIRSALGAGRWRLIRQALMECGVLGSAAGVLGILASSWATVATLKYFSAAIQPIDIDPTPGMRTIAVALVCTGVVIAFGLAAWMRMIAVPAATAISLTPGPAAAHRRRTFGWRLVLVAQLALCAALSFGTGVLLRSIINLRTQDLGFDRNVLMVSASSITATQSERAASMLMGRAMERLAALPGVAGVAVSGAGFLDNAFYWVDGSQLLSTDRGAAAPGVRWTSAAVGARFFDVVGMPMVHGRGFTDGDTAAGSGVVVINQSLARLLFGDIDPVGRRIGTTPRGPNQEIIGVVNDVKQTSPRDRGLGVVYVPMRGGDRWIVAVRTTGDPSGAAPIVRRALTSLDTPVRVDRIRTIAELLDDAIAQERLTCALAFILGALVILVGSVGLYALIANDVGQQAREIGIRLALGASRRSIAALVLRDASSVIVAALALGLPLGVGAVRPLAPQLYLVHAADPLTLGLVAVLLPALALAAAWRPAHTASRIDPATLLRCD